MARKVFISFLGATNYGDCDYTKDGQSYGRVRFIQEATLHYLTQKEAWGEGDVAYILLTTGAENANWVDHVQQDVSAKKYIQQSGLETCLEKYKTKYGIDIRSIKNLPDGNNEKEIWKIFERTYSEIIDGDELYFDITHGYRYLPMLMLVLGNYAKFLKKVAVKSITYGNYEISKRGKYPGIIVDLLPLSQLQDWTFAAGQYLDSGNVNKMVDLCENELKPILAIAKGKDADASNLKQFVKYLKVVNEERQTCRGNDILNSTNFKTLKGFSEKVEDTIISPLNPIIRKIKDSLSNFDEQTNIKNIFAAVNWCLQNGLYQQSATILQEGVVTYFCLRHNIDINDEEKREIINSAFVIKFENLKEESWRIDDENKDMLKEVLSDKLISNKDIVNLFQNLTEVRNDYNHSGMRSKRAPMSPSSIKKNIEKCKTGFEEYLDYSFSPVLKNNFGKVFINFTNHPSSLWDAVQKEAARKEFGDIVDVTFPIISPDADEEEIGRLADEYVQKIKETAGDKTFAVHLMGEMTFTFAVLKRLLGEGVTCVASTTERIVSEMQPGHKDVTFKFVKFRRYE